MTFQVVTRTLTQSAFHTFLPSTPGKVTRGLQIQGNMRSIPEVVSLLVLSVNSRVRLVSSYRCNTSRIWFRTVAVPFLFLSLLVISLIYQYPRYYIL